MRWLALPLLVACGGEGVPVAQADPVVTIDEDGTAAFSLGGVDARGDEGGLSVTVTEAPAVGVLSVSSGPSPLDVTWAPPADWAGATALSFVVTDPEGVESAPRHVSLVVVPVEDAPFAQDDAAATDSVTPIVVNPLANDLDPEGSALAVQSVGTPSSGTAVVQSADAIRYTPDPSGSGPATFTYTAVDSAGKTATATVTVTVAAGVPLVIDRFVALPAWPVTGQGVTLVWETTGATSCALDHGADTQGAADGSARVVVDASSTFVLTCEGPGGPASERVTVETWPYDTDGDGLSDLGEFVLGADPMATDTDGDGLPDGAELRTDPTDPDSDRDGWPDGLEDLDLDGALDPHERDPAHPDSDRDGVCDGPRGVGGPADPCVDPDVWYVDANGFGTSNGQSWATSYRSIQEAIDAAEPNDLVFVAGGRYVAPAPGLSLVTVAQTKVHVFGGFAGGEASLLDRVWPPEATVLDGDFDGDGFNPGTPSTVEDNAQTVVVVTDGELTLEGFVLRGGRGRPDPGSVGTIPNIHAAMDLTRATVRVIGSEIRSNYADRGAGGGGVQSTVRLARSVVVANDGAGATLSFVGSDVGVFDTRIADNDLAALSMTDGRLDLVRSTVARNPAGTGAMYLSGVDTVLVDTDVVGNVNTPSPCCNGSAMTITGADGSLVAVDASFVGNTGGYGAISVTDAPVTLTNVTFSGNIPTSATGPTRGGAVTSCNAVVSVRNAVFQGNGTNDVARRACLGNAPTVQSSVSNLPLAAGAGNVLASNVTTTLPSGEVVLVEGTAAVDAGSDAFADDAVSGYLAFGAVWRQRATTAGFVPDASPVDAGRHYGRDRLVIFGFGAEPDLAWWDVSGARTCAVEIEGDLVADLDWPSQGDVSANPGDEVTLTCDAEWGGRTVEATLTVPAP